MKFLSVLSVLSVTLLLGCASEEAKGPDEPVVFQEGDAFYKLLNMTSGNYVELDDTGLVERSSLVAVGHIIRVEDGMEIKNVDARVPTSLHTMVMAVQVDKVLKGDTTDDVVYVEYLHGGAFSAATFDANRPTGSSVLFLTEAEWGPHRSVQYLNRDRGRPAGKPLYRLITPQGWFTEIGGKLTQPLAGNGNTQGFVNAVSLAAVQDAVQAADPAQGASSSEGLAEDDQ